MKARIPTLAASLAACLAVAVAAPSLAATYKVDTVHSTVIFRVKHANTSYAYGRFNDLSGSFAIDEANPAASSFDFTIKVDSIDTANPARDGHVKNDVFNAKQFPAMTFKSKKVASAGTGAFDVTGDLTAHGVTKPITVRINLTGTGKGQGGAAIAGIESTFAIKRSEFGMRNLIPMLGDDITVTVSSEGIAK